MEGDRAALDLDEQPVGMAEGPGDVPTKLRSGALRSGRSGTCDKGSNVAPAWQPVGVEAVIAEIARPADTGPANHVGHRPAGQDRERRAIRP